MAIQTIDNFNVVAKKPTDSRYTDPSGTPWASTGAVTTGINSNQRYVGLTVAIGTPAVEWWFKGGIADGNLVEKAGAGSAGAENGLNIYTNNKVRLGGTLLTTTAVDLSTYKLTLKDSGAAPTGIEIVPGAADNANWTTANVNIVTGKLSGVSNAKFDSNVGIGVIPSTNQTLGTKLDVYRSFNETSFPTEAFYISRSDLLLSPSIVGGALSNSLNICAAYNRNGLYATPTSGSITAAASSEAFYCGTYSEFTYGAHSATTTSNGNISAIAARGYFIYNSNIDTFITNRIMSPVSDSVSPYTGTISELVGLRIDDQRKNTVINTSTFKSYGIQQKGRIDYNYFAANTGIGIEPEPETDPIATSNSKLNVYRYTGYSSNPIAVTVNSTLNMADDLGSGNTSLYAANFGNLRWAPTTNQDVPTDGSIAGTSAYLSLVSANDTINGLLSASSSQIYTAAASSVFISGVNSSGATITVPVGTNMANIQPGYQVLIKPSGGTGSFGYVNVYVNTVNTGLRTFTLKRISGGSRGAWTYTTGVVPSVTLSGASIVVAKAASGDDLGSIDLAIGSRILAPAPDAYSGSSFRIDSAVGLQIDDQQSGMPDPNTPWNPSITLTSGYISGSYGIKQLGNNDVNLYNAIINNLPNLPVYATNALALAGGLTVGTIYRTATGELRIVI
jgi:hypothetical protein